MIEFRKIGDDFVFMAKCGITLDQTTFPAQFSFDTQEVLEIYLWILENDIHALFEVDGCQIEMALLGKNRDEILNCIWNKVIVEFYNEDDATHFMLRWGGG